MAFMSGRLLEVCPNQASGSLLPQALRIILSVGKRGEGPGASMGDAPGHFSLSNAFACSFFQKWREKVPRRVAARGGKRAFTSAAASFLACAFAFSVDIFLSTPVFGKKKAPCPPGKGEARGLWGFPSGAGTTPGNPGRRSQRLGCWDRRTSARRRSRC